MASEGHPSAEIRRRRRLTRIGAPALWALRTYRGTSVLLVCVVVVTLAAMIPVTSLLRDGRSLDTRLTVSAPGEVDARTGWEPPARTPAATRQAAISELYATLFGATAGVGLVACLTLAGLFGARASARAIEVSARRAVGASQRLVAGSTAVEGAALAVAGIVPGAAAGAITARLAAASWPGSVGDGTPVATVMAVCGLALVVVLCAMLPLIFARQRRIEDASDGPLQLAIPALQLGMSLVVLTGGALLVRHAGDTIPPSERQAAQGEVFRQTDPGAAPAARAIRYAALLDQLAAGGRFDTVSLTTAGALVGLGMVSAVTTDCGECSEGGIFLPWHIVPATHQFVSADSFHALGVRLLAGRGITSRDRWGTEPVAVVSRGLALRHFQRGEAIGRKILLGDDPRTWHTVVGIVDDRPLRGVGAALQPPFTVYASVLQHPVPAIELLVRAKGSAAVDATTVATVGRALVSGGGPPTSMTEAGMLAADARPLAWFSRWLGLEGWTMLVLACGGTFALMRLWVLSLLAELGLRRALGAKRWQLVRFVLLRAAAVGLAGVGVGVWFGPAVWSALASGTAGVPVWHAPTVMRFALLLVFTAVAGALLPALRAVRSAPARLLSWT